MWEGLSETTTRAHDHDWNVDWTGGKLDPIGESGGRKLPGRSQQKTTAIGISLPSLPRCRLTPAHRDPVHWSLKQWHQFNKPDRESERHHNTAALSISLLTHFPSWLPPFSSSSSSAKQTDDNFVFGRMNLLSVMTQIFIRYFFFLFFPHCSAIKKKMLYKMLQRVTGNVAFLGIISCWKWLLIFSTVPLELLKWGFNRIPLLQTKKLNLN